MSYLLDTNVISELRKAHRCDRHVAAWQRSVMGQPLFVSVISLMEIKRGILSARHRDARFSELLESWYENQVKPAFSGRILSVDLEISEQCSVLLESRTRGLADAQIAATASVHALTLVTRNVAEFTDCEIGLLNPWEFPAI